MIVYIHSHEIEDRGVTMGRHAAARDIAHIIVPDGTSVGGIVDLVNEQVAHANSVWTLIFNGHGDEGRTGAIYFGDWIDSSNVGEFSPLNRLMNRAGRGVELHCCRAASSETMLKYGAGIRCACDGIYGRQLGRAGRHLGPVTLPIGGDSYGLIEGQTVVAFPNGRTAYSSAAE